jgi:hypothetical protein
MNSLFTPEDENGVRIIVERWAEVVIFMVAPTPIIKLTWVFCLEPPTVP